MSSPAAVPSAAPPAPARTRALSIISPLTDTLCVGGLSILVFVPLLAAGVRDLSTVVNLQLVVFGQMVFNYAHFMASYRIVYRDREMIMKHKWASIGIPLILLVALSVGLVEAQGESRLMLITFFAVASGYLAWHYTGQAWGMMVSFAHLEGVRYTRLEYWLIRGGLRLLLFWHVTWFLRLAMRPGQFPEVIYDVASALTVGAALTGIAGLVHLTRRTGRYPPFRALVAWVAIFVWYAAIARWGLPGLFLVQLSHAIQYLEFPARVEFNRAARESGGRAARHMLAYTAGLLGVTLLVTLMVPGPTMRMAADLLGVEPGTVAPVFVSYLIGIHHFFTDGVVWKLRDPEVQKDLFAHARPVAATIPVPPMWWEKRWWQQAFKRPTG